MFNWISGFLEKQIIKWLAKQLNLDPLYLSTIMNDVVLFLKKIFDVFGDKFEATQFFQAVGKEHQTLVNQKAMKEKLLELKGVL